MVVLCRCNRKRGGFDLSVLASVLIQFSVRWGDYSLSMGWNLAMVIGLAAFTCFTLVCFHLQTMSDQSSLSLALGAHRLNVNLLSSAGIASSRAL